MLILFKKFIKTNQLFQNSDKILLTISGGIDSMVMLDLFIKSNIKIAVAHCNFVLRGNESDGDEKLVFDTCQKNNIEFFTAKFNTNSFAEENKISIQMAARQLRYEWFNKIALENNCQFIATAHHQNDVAETMLINITRGTGISGLHGILPKNNNIIRPLLFTNKTGIINYANENNVDFREDSSNKKDDYWRNKIRHWVIPKLEELNTNAVNNFYLLSKKVSADEILLNERINELKSLYVKTTNNLVYIKLEIMKHAAVTSLLFKILSEYNINESAVLNIIENHENNSGIIFESDTHEVLIDRAFIIVRERKVEEFQQTLLIENTIIKINTPTGEINFETLNKKPSVFSKNSLYINKDKAGTEFMIQTWKQGDRFIPLGMNGSKLISDFLLDKKINVFDKQKCMVLISKKNNEIVAVLPYQINNDYKLENDSKNILKISF
jgi:tRNA(Ile)-lysidine synthase